MSEAPPSYFDIDHNVPPPPFSSAREMTDTSIKRYNSLQSRENISKQIENIRLEHKEKAQIVSDAELSKQLRRKEEKNDKKDMWNNALIDLQLYEKLNPLPTQLEIEKLREEREKQRLLDLEELTDSINLGLQDKLILDRSNKEMNENIIFSYSEWTLTDKKFYQGCICAGVTPKENIKNLAILYVFDKPLSKQTAPQLWYDGGIRQIFYDRGQQHCEEYIKMIS